MAGIATGLRVQLQIGVDPSEASAFTSFEVHRSTMGSSGPYVEVTGPTWSAPRLTTEATSTPLSGTTLSLQVDEATLVPIVFSGTDPLSASTQAAQITAQGLGLIVAQVSGSDLVLQGVSPGAASTLRVLPSEGAALLQLPQEEPESVAFGTELRPALSGSGSYSFTDPHGSPDYFYKIRLRNTAQNSVSDFSAPFRATINGLPEDNLVSCYAELYDVTGKPRMFASVLIETVAGTAADGRLIVGRDLRLTTDESGRATSKLVRGTTVRVTVPDANLHRRFVVPVDPSVVSVNLLDVQEGEDDAFTVQRPELEFATRRST